MGYEELAEALRKEGDASCVRILDEAETEIRAMNDAWDDDLATMTRESLLISAQECSLARERGNAEAARRTGRILLEAENVLAIRLWQRAVSLLPHLRGERYHEQFQIMIRSLPAVGWSRVRVNPGDREQAKTLLPGVEIGDDPSISGGIEAETADGKVMVTDTLEKRLERFWPELLPELMREVQGVIAEFVPAKS